MDVGQLEMVILNALMGKDHPYRRLKELLDFHKISRSAKAGEHELGAIGYGKKRLAICMVFTFVDATALTSKLAMWEERDKSIQDGYEKFNNEVIKKYAKDRDVRIGSKKLKKVLDRLQKM